MFCARPKPEYQRTGRRGDHFGDSKSWKTEFFQHIFWGEWCVSSAWLQKKKVINEVTLFGGILLIRGLLTFHPHWPSDVGSFEETLYSNGITSTIATETSSTSYPGFSMGFLGEDGPHPYHPPPMYGIFPYIYYKNQPNVGKYTIHYHTWMVWVSRTTAYNLHRLFGPFFFWISAYLFYLGGSITNWNCPSPRVWLRFICYLERIGKVPPGKEGKKNRPWLGISKWDWSFCGNLKAFKRCMSWCDLFFINIKRLVYYLQFFSTIMIQTTLPPMVQCMASLVLTNGHVLHVSHLNDVMEGHPPSCGWAVLHLCSVGFCRRGKPKPDVWTGWDCWTHLLMASQLNRPGTRHY